MADVFISYSREDRSRVESLAGALRRAGYSVWWDQNLTTGTRFLRAIETELQAARAVIVVWSRSSVASHWVADEASEARDSGRLVPLTVDGTPPPLGFRQFQVLDFSSASAAEGAAFASLRAALSRLIESPDAPTTTTAAQPAATARRALPVGGWVAAGAALAAIVALLTLGLGWPGLRGHAAPLPPRLAFFGFDAVGNDPLLAGIADAATTELFRGLGLQQVPLAARSETEGTAADQRFARAAALDARFVLSGSIRQEPGRPEQVRVGARLEDTATRTTLWEDSFTADGADPLPVAVRAATRSGDTALCLIREYPALASSVNDARLLPPLATYCGGWRGAGTPESNRALQRLAELAPQDPVLQARLLPWMMDELIDNLDRPARLPELLARADAQLRSIEKADPGNFEILPSRSLHMLLAGTAVTEVMAYWQAGLGQPLRTDRDIAGYQQANGMLGGTLLNLGLYSDAMPYLRVAAETDPLSRARGIYYAWGLALTSDPEAAAQLGRLHARWPDTLTAEALLAGAVLLGAGDAAELLAAPPKSIPAATLTCWRGVHAALRTRDPGQRADGAARARKCLEQIRTDDWFMTIALSALGDFDAVFAMAAKRAFWLAEEAPSYAFFSAPSRRLRSDPRLLPLLDQAGLMRYWRDTGRAPDVCADEPAPFCLALEGAATEGTARP